MNSGAHCEECGAVIPADSPSGYCGQCLFSLGLETAGEQPSAPAAAGAVARAKVRYLGDYELLEEIARGGMGVVFKARQVSLNRLVAVKLISSGALATEELVKRFKAEAEAAASLSHPNIVPIYEVGEHQGQQYFSMGLIEGRNLRTEIANRKSPIANTRWAASLLSTIARAVHYAHQRGVLHRDIKPSNILLDSAGEPHLTDFGLAKLIEKESTLTHTNAVMGTPAYMSPEQARGETKDVTTAADVYGLGAVLYETLTGSPPFGGGTSMETIRQVLEQEPRRPSIFNPAIDRDLETITLKCLQKEPFQRYSTAQELSKELERFLRGEPIDARRASAPEKLWRWCKRKPALALSASAAMLLFISGAAGVLLTLQRAVRGEIAARRNLYNADMSLAMQAHSDGNPGRVLELLEKHRPRVAERDLRGWEWRYLWQQTQSDELFTLGRHANRVASIAFSPDGRTLVSASFDGTAKFWDVDSRRSFRSLEHPDGVRAAIYSLDGRLVATACWDGNVRLWDTADWSVRRIFADGNRLDGISLAPSGRLLATASPDSVKLWDTESGEVLGRWPSSPEIAVGTAFSPDGKMFAFSGVAGEIVLWDLQDETKRIGLRGHKDTASSLTFSRDSKTLVSASWDRTVRVWDLNTYSERTNLTGFLSWVACVALSPDDRVLATASADHQTKLWDTRTWAELATLIGHSDEVWGVAFSPDGAHLATAGKDETIRWWKNKPKPISESVRRFSSAISSKNWIRPSPDGSAVVTVHGSRSNRVTTLWHTRDLTDVSLTQLPAKTLLVGVGPSNEWFALSEAVSGSNGPITLWSGKGHRLIARLPGEGEEILRSAFSLDGSMLAVGRAEGRVEIWNVPQQRLVARFDGPRSRPLKLTFTPNGAALAVAYNNSVLILWDVKRNRQINSFKPHKAECYGLAFSPDGKILATAATDAKVKLWQVPSLKQVAVLSGHRNSTISLAFSPDGHRLAAGAGDGEILLWDMTTTPPQEVGRLKGHNTYVHDLFFSSNGNSLVSITSEEIRAWRAAPLAEVFRSSHAGSR